MIFAVFCVLELSIAYDFYNNYPINIAQANSVVDAQLDQVPHSDSQQKYTIQGPKGWTFTKSTTGNQLFMIFLSPNPEKDQQGNVVFNENINIYHETTNLSLDGYVTKSKALLTNQLQDYHLENEMYVTINNLVGKVIIYSFTQNSLQLKTMQLFVAKDNTVYVATGTNQASKWDNDSDILEASIMSLKPSDSGQGELNSAETLISKSDTFIGQGKFEEALQASEKAIELNPQLAGAWLDKGVALESQSKHDEALQAIEMALELNPQYAIAWKDKGNILLGLGRYDEAILAYGEAIRQNPNNVEAWNNEGLALYNEERCDEAIQCFDKVIELTPNGNPIHQEALKNRGLALNKQYTSMQKYRNVLPNDEKWAAEGTGKMGRGVSLYPPAPYTY